MGRAAITLILLGFLRIPVHADNFGSMGAAATASGGCSVASTHTFSLSDNQGTAAFIRSIAVTLDFSTSWLPGTADRFGLSAAIPLGSGVIGGSLSYFGNSFYRAMKTGLGYALKVGEKVGIGVQLDYLDDKAAGYPGRRFITFEAGMLYRPSEAVAIGVHVFNPLRYKASETTGELLPIVFRTGVEYRPVPRLKLMAELEKDLFHSFNFRTGIDCELAGGISVRGGISTVPVVASFGLGYALREFMNFDLACEYHMHLGFRTGASIAFFLGDKNAPGD